MKQSYFNKVFEKHLLFWVQINSNAVYKVQYHALKNLTWKFWCWKNLQIFSQYEILLCRAFQMLKIDGTSRSLQILRSLKLIFQHWQILGINPKTTSILYPLVTTISTPSWCEPWKSIVFLIFEHPQTRAFVHVSLPWFVDIRHVSPGYRIVMGIRDDYYE